MMSTVDQLESKRQQLLKQSRDVIKRKCRSMNLSCEGGKLDMIERIMVKSHPAIDTNAAEQQYASYCDSFGYPPQSATHLMSFAQRQNKVKITWKEAKQVIKDNEDALALQALSDQNERKAAKLRTAKRYSSNRRVASSKSLLSSSPYAAIRTSSKILPKLPGLDKRTSVARHHSLLFQLTAMGWDEQQAASALKAANGNLMNATEALMNGSLASDDTVVDEHFIQTNDDMEHNKYVRYNGLLEFSSYPSNASNVSLQSESSGLLEMPRSKSNAQHHTTASSTHGFVRYNALLDFADMAIQEMEDEEMHDTEPKRQSTTTTCLNVSSAQSKPLLQFIPHNPSTPWSPLSPETPFSVSPGIPDVSPPPPTPSVSKSTTSTPGVSVDDAFEKLLSGHGSIKHRLRSLETVYNNLSQLDISTDNGQVLLDAFVEQVLHEDHIYGEHKVRIKALEQMADVFMFCLNKCPFEQIPTLVDTSLPALFDALYKFLDNNRYQKFHDLARQCLMKVIDAVIGKRNKSATINLCGLLNAKINSENITQANPRFLTAKIIFQKIIFGESSAKINALFNIDIDSYSNKIQKWTNLPAVAAAELPMDRMWLNMLTAKEYNNDEEETLRDIVADCLSVMLIDPNYDIEVIGANLTIFLCDLNEDFRNWLEPEAKYRFRKRYARRIRNSQMRLAANSNWHDHTVQVSAELLYSAY